MSIIHDRSPLALVRMRLASALLLMAGAVAAQQPDVPATQMQHEHQQATQVRELEFPRLGRAQAKAGVANLFTLDRALETARLHNPTLRQADAGIRVAKARAQQEGLYPNPTVGYFGDEIRGGESGGGKQGFFVEQTIVTGGKLSRAGNS